jgi:hypothetical protein
MQDELASASRERANVLQVGKFHQLVALHIIEGLVDGVEVQFQVSLGLIEKHQAALRKVRKKEGRLLGGGLESCQKSRQNNKNPFHHLIKECGWYHNRPHSPSKIKPVYLAEPH